MANLVGTNSSSNDRNGQTTSYMWYIHILIKVNTEDRLRDHIAPFLQHDVSSCVASPGISSVSLSDEHDSMHGSGGNKMEKITDLTDYLVLHFFNNEILGQLVDTAPLLEQAGAYSGILSGVPENFREEFCRRLYVLLFSKNIVEWPPGIDVPDPAAAAAIAAGASPHPGQRDPEPSDAQEGQGSPGSETTGRRRRGGSNASSAATASSSCCPDGGSDHDSEMARPAYFGTASSPLPWNYFADWHLSRNGYGSLPGYSEYDVADNGSSHRQPAPPHATPQQQGQRQHQQQEHQQQEQQQYMHMQQQHQQHRQQQQEEEDEETAVVSRRYCPSTKTRNAEDLSDDISPAPAYQRLSRVNPHHLHRSSGVVGAAVVCDGGGASGGSGGGGAVRIRQVSGQGGNRLLSPPGFSPAVPGADLASDYAMAVDEEHIWGRDWDQRASPVGAPPGLTTHPRASRRAQRGSYSLRRQ